jgi:curli production assembly/transport component CsgF
MRDLIHSPTLREAIISIALLCITAASSYATELVYTPVNPSFGGNPLNGPVLLNSAQAQNNHKDPNDPASQFAEKTPLQQFNDNLERSVVGQLAAAATSSIMGPNGKLTPGTVETGNFRISVIDLGGGRLQITTTDKTTGAVTSFEVGQ